jgi:thioredoxin-related protein
MPQIKEVAAHFQDRPVAILGMNTDENEDDARFVVEKMELRYTNLKAAGLHKKYHVTGFPTLLILDQDGVIREEVIKSVEQLLGPKS